MLNNKKGIIFGIANDHSIAWGIAKKLSENGAEIGICYQNDTLLKRVKPLAEKINSNLLIKCDFSEKNSIDIQNVISNSFGFGGTNATLGFSRIDA